MIPITTRSDEFNFIDGMLTCTLQTRVCISLLLCKFDTVQPKKHTQLRSPYQIR